MYFRTHLYFFSYFDLVKIRMCVLSDRLFIVKQAVFFLLIT